MTNDEFETLAQMIKGLHDDFSAALKRVTELQIQVDILEKNSTNFFVRMISMERLFQ